MKKLLLGVSVFLFAVAVNAQNPYPIITIDTSQYVSLSKLSATPPNDSPDYIAPMKNLTYRDTIRIEGYVLFDPRLYGLSTSRKASYLQADTIARAWGGNMMMCEPSGTGVNLATLISQTKFYDNLKPGMKVRYTGVIRSFQGDNQVNALKANPSWDNSIEILDLGPNTIHPAVIPTSDVQLGNVNTGYMQQKTTGEKWEGVYVELRDITVLSRQVSGNRWNWSVGDNQGNGLDIRDFSGWFRNDNNADSTLPAARFTPPTIGTKISYIRGVITEYIVGGSPRYGISPLLPSDLGPLSYTPPTVASSNRMPIMANNTDSVLVSAKIQQGSTHVGSVKLFYANGINNTMFDSIMLTRNTLPNDTMIWFGKIPPMADGSVVAYKIRPIDANGEFTTSADAAYLVKTNGVQTIKDLQFSPFANNATIWHNDSLYGMDVRGIVTSTNMTQGSLNILTVQNGNDSNCAIIVNRRTGDGTNTWKVGDSVSITSAIVRESFGVTTLNNLRGTVISSNNALPPVKTDLMLTDVVTLNSNFNTRSALTPWEGFIVRFDSVYVINKNADAPSNFGEFYIHHDMNAAVGVRVDDISTSLPDLFNDNLAPKQFMDYAQGVFYLAFSNWKLEPRDSMDLDFSHAPDTEAPILTLLGDNPHVMVQYTSYMEAGFTAMDNKDGDITANVVVTGAVDTATVGSYTLTYTITDAAMNTTVKTRTVNVTPAVGINENDLLFAQVNVYPSPANDFIIVKASHFNTLPLNVNIVDITGRTITTRTYNTKSVSDRFDVSNYNNGVYFLNLTNNNGSKTIKFVVSK